MIKIYKRDEPEILADNKARWTADLLDLVKKYGSYSDIPKKEKEYAIKNYSHPDVVSALKGESGKAKCVYCESYVDVTCYANIEHFHPKSICPNETFEWDNLFVGCTVCNTPKNNFDTSKEAFVHPVKDNPEDYLTFDDLVYIPKSKKGIAFQKARNVINNCNLERIPLARKHAEIQYTFMATKDALVKKIENYCRRRKDSKRLQDAVDILISLNTLSQEASDGAEYAGYMRYLLRKFPVIKEAVDIINMHKDDLGLLDGFIWSFDFEIQ